MAERIYLLADQNAVPTLVEVKRGDNRELRHVGLGQMPEHAAHASRTWATSELREAFETSAIDHSPVVWHGAWVVHAVCIAK